MAKQLYEIQTNLGNIIVELFAIVAPNASYNFAALASSHYYKDSSFHRVIPGFMIQGGELKDKSFVSVWGGPFADECRPDIVFDRPGILAMANSGPNSNGTQFFITLAPCQWLNGKHTIFGRVIKGMDVVHSIANSPKDKNDKPNVPVIVTEIREFREQPGI
jgi:cyclophilin family peptidyl-prolyl cis-trans isomerase